LALQWHYGPIKGSFLVYIGDSLFEKVDSTRCTIVNLLSNHTYPVKVVFCDSNGAISLPSATVLCTTKPVPVAVIPLYVDLAGPAHGSWVPENIWSDTVSHGMLENLQKDYTSIGQPASAIDTVMATMFEGNLHYVIRAPRDEYVLTLYLYDPFVHSSSRTFTISVDGTAHADSVISSPGLKNNKPWSALVQFQVVADSMIRFSLIADSSLLPLSSGFALGSEHPFTVTTVDTVAIGDTLVIRWYCNQTSVASADIYMSADNGKSWTMINDRAIGRSDSAWGYFAWIVPSMLDQEQLGGGNLMVKVSDYNNTLFGTTSCFIRNLSNIRGDPRHVRGRVQITFVNNTIRISGNYTSGFAKLFKLNGMLVSSIILHEPDAVDLRRLPRAMYLTELNIDGTTYRNKMFVR
jgi:hypothetical protein